MFADGQDSAFALLLLVLGLRCLGARRDLAAGMLVGAGAFKPTLFLMIPLLLLLQRRRRALAAFVVVGGALTIWSFSLVGIGGLQAYARLLSSEFWRQTNAANWWKMQSLPALLQLQTSGFATTALTIGSTLAGQLLFWCSRLARATADAAPTLAFTQAILLTALVSPHFFMYDCVTLVVPALLLLDADPRSTVLRLALLAAWLATWSSALRFLAFGALPFPLWLLAVPPLPLVVPLLVWQANRIGSPTTPLARPIVTSPIL
jgi:hypothetical protein